MERKVHRPHNTPIARIICGEDAAKLRHRCIALARAGGYLVPVQEPKKLIARDLADRNPALALALTYAGEKSPKTVGSLGVDAGLCSSFLVSWTRARRPLTRLLEAMLLGREKAGPKTIEVLVGQSEAVRIPRSSHSTYCGEGVNESSQASGTNGQERYGRIGRAVR